MAEPSIDDITDAIKTTLAATVGWDTFNTAVQREEDLTEDIVVRPLIQIYWEKERTDSRTQTSMSTFVTGLQVTTHLIHVDVYARQRSQIGIDMEAMRFMVDAVRGVLRTQRQAPFFGVAGMEAFRWRADRVVFAYGNPEVNYSGVRFQIEVDTFMTTS